MSIPADVRDELISLATAALVEAEADAKNTGELIFRDEWKPTPRTRTQTTESHRLQQGQASPGPPPSPATTTTPTTSRPSPGPATPPGVPPTQLFHEPITQPPDPIEDAVAKLLRINHDVFDGLLNHPFPRSLGNGSASLDGFRYYMIQDTFYLETCARLKMATVAWAPTFEDIKNFVPRHKSSLEYVTSSKDILASLLGIAESVVDSTPRSNAVDESEEFYRTSVQQKDAFFAFVKDFFSWHVIKFIIQVQALDNGLQPWIQVNDDSSSADKYIKFINANIAAKGGVDRWSAIFRTACQLEINIFNTGLRAPQPYQIVPSGTYSIRSHLSAAGSQRVWRITATENGYTFQNVGSDQFLGIANKLDRAERRVLQAAVQPDFWWINPVQKQPSQWAAPLYRIHETKNLRYTLHADTQSANDVVSGSTVIVSLDNSEGPSRMWSFELERSGVVPEPTGNVQEVAADMISKFAQFLQQEFKEIRVGRKKHDQDVRGVVLIEAQREITTTGPRIMGQLSNLFANYENRLLVGLESLERRRRDNTASKIQQLMQETERAVNSEGARKIRDILNRYAEMIQNEFDALERTRQEETRETKGKVLAEAQRGTSQLAELSDQMLEEDFRGNKGLRKVAHEQMIEELRATVVQ
ncbi:hypothetical protein H0H93_009092 [Arthromyces matolae]|nr:hypothetical protein H0H93_009092 [Arthromyces matolae]